ncbi:glycosyltransferase family 4 protein [Rothia sp. P5766]|uniref:glycosyltransferase family 4 protein n=1 Tax=unclassified Rothia (in: high G+C Gram-positive bacteria) TaxID=2689056 RepID=UPI003AED2120
MKLIVDARYTRIGFHDGISRYTASLLTALHELIESQDSHLPRDFQLVMAIHDLRQLEMLPPLPYITICSPTSALEPLAALQLNRHNPDVVFSPMQTLGLGGLGRKFKLILTLHDLIYYSYPTPPSFLPLPVRLGWRVFHSTYAPQQYLLNSADAVATVSATTADLIRQHSLTHRCLVEIPNAPQPGSIVTEAQALAALSTRTKDLIYMGSFMPYKNVETLLRAMKFLPDYRLHLLSKISPHRKAELLPLAGSNVTFHNGVSDEEYRNWLGRAHALLTASKDEGYGLPVAEAQAAGCPVVLSDIPIFREIAPNAHFASTHNAWEFAQAIRGLSAPAVAQQAVRAGLKDSQRYSWQASALTLVETAMKLYQGQAEA